MDNTNNMNNIDIKDNSTLYIVLGAIQFMLCNTLTGVLTIVLAILAKQDLTSGNMKAYNDKINAAKIVTIVGIVLGVIIMIYLAIVILTTFGILAGLSY